MGKNKLRLTLVVWLLWLFAATASGQTAPGKYWVRFKDKDDRQMHTLRPTQVLSQRAVERRARYGIGYDWYDLPIKWTYINQLLNHCQCSIHNRSRWFNAVTISIEDTTLIPQIAGLHFVAEVRAVHTWMQPHDDAYIKNKISLQPLQRHDECPDQFWEYGSSYDQVSMLNAHLLHTMGYRGEGMHIALLDAGWYMTDKLPAFERLRAEKRIADMHDFVKGGKMVFDHHSHGTYVLSTMAAWLPGQLIGTAPEATYYLYRTEDGDTEYLVEEDNWVAAAERCDSLGVDIINSSLGYSLFDDTLMNHTYADMDGNTTRISRAADLAAAKGILVVNSAGNSGNSPWHYITAPSDGDSVLCVGAVNALREHAPFSSFGPSSDGDVKPNVCAMGWGSAFALLDSTVANGNGTSFSSPVIAGAAACLWQTNRSRSNMEVFRAIERSADLFLNPNDSLGYGIPDVWKAYQMLSTISSSDDNALQLVVRPNPFSDVLHVSVLHSEPCVLHLVLYDLSGRKIIEIEKLNGAGGVAGGWLSLGRLSPGAYILQVSDGDKTVRHVVVRG